MRKNGPKKPRQIDEPIRTTGSPSNRRLLSHIAGASALICVVLAGLVTPAQGQRRVAVPHDSELRDTPDYVVAFAELREHAPRDRLQFVIADRFGVPFDNVRAPIRWQLVSVATGEVLHESTTRLRRELRMPGGTTIRNAQEIITPRRYARFRGPGGFEELRIVVNPGGELAEERTDNNAWTLVMGKRCGLEDGCNDFGQVNKIHGVQVIRDDPLGWLWVRVHYSLHESLASSSRSQADEYGPRDAIRVDLLQGSSVTAPQIAHCLNTRGHRGVLVDRRGFVDFACVRAGYLGSGSYVTDAIRVTMPEDYVGAPAARLDVHHRKEWVDGQPEPIASLAHLPDLRVGIERPLALRSWVDSQPLAFYVHNAGSSFSAPTQVRVRAYAERGPHFEELVEIPGLGAGETYRSTAHVPGTSRGWTQVLACEPSSFSVEVDPFAKLVERSDLRSELGLNLAEGFLPNCGSGVMRLRGDQTARATGTDVARIGACPLPDGPLEPAAPHPSPVGYLQSYAEPRPTPAGVCGGSISTEHQAHVQLTNPEWPPRGAIRSARLYFTVLGDWDDGCPFPVGGVAAADALPSDPVRTFDRITRRPPPPQSFGSLGYSIYVDDVTTAARRWQERGVKPTVVFRSSLQGFGGNETRACLAVIENVLLVVDIE